MLPIHRVFRRYTKFNAQYQAFRRCCVELAGDREERGAQRLIRSDSKDKSENPVPDSPGLDAEKFEVSLRSLQKWTSKFPKCNSQLEISFHPRHPSRAGHVYYIPEDNDGRAARIIDSSLSEGTARRAAPNRGILVKSVKGSNNSPFNPRATDCLATGRAADAGSILTHSKQLLIIMESNIFRQICIVFHCLGLFFDEYC